MSNIYDLISDLIPDPISDVIVESVFVTLQNEHKDNIDEIIKGVINFLKENNLTNAEIRRSLKKFFWIQRDYIYLEFGVRYTDIGEIVEKILTPPVIQVNESDSTESKSEESTESTNSQAELPSVATSNINPNTLETNNIFDNLFNVQYQPMYFNANQINPSTVEVLNSLLGSHGTNNHVHVIGQQNPYIEYIQQPILMQYPANQLLGNFGLALNMFNIILQNPPINDPNMEDVKNVINSEELSQLPIKTYEEVDKEKHKTCAICLEDYDKESQLRILKCDHSFHKDCVDKWLTDCDYKCPVCRDDSNKHHANV
jgi:hypothetical protein